MIILLTVLNMLGIASITYVYQKAYGAGIWAFLFCTITTLCLVAPGIIRLTGVVK